MSAKALNKILHDTVDNIENNKSHIYDIYESVRNEVETSRRELKEIKKIAAETIERVDKLTAEEQEQKQNLVRVSSNFADYSEDKIKECYERVKDVQIDLNVAREKEHVLRQQRDQLELRLRSLKHTLEKAESLTMAIGSVLGFLSKQLSGVMWQLESAQKNHNLGAAMIKAQEDERLRVSRELHDGAAQDIANLIFQSSIIEKTIDIDPDEAKHGLQELRGQIRDCLKEIRQVIFDMRPMSLDDLGLAPALNQLVAKLHERDVLDAQISVSGNEPKLSKYVEVGLFRIVQEALSNVHKHAGVREAKVRVLFNDAAVSILVTDAGKGFDPDSLEQKIADEETEDIEPESDDEMRTEPHYGLLGMKERARLIGAEISVVSAPNKGTRVHIRLPLRPQAGKKGASSDKSAK